MNIKHKTQTLWEKILQSQSIEEERSNIDELTNFLKKKNLSFRVWQVSKNGEKKLLNNAVKPNQKKALNTIQVEIFFEKTEIYLSKWEPISTDNIWRLYFE